MQKILKKDLTLPKEENQKVIRLMKDELGGKIMKVLFGLVAKTYSYLKDNNDEYKKAKHTKKRTLKKQFKFQDYKNCLEASQIENKINHLEKIRLCRLSQKRPKKFIKRIN